MSFWLSYFKFLEVVLSFNKSFYELKFDKRMKDWNLKRGVVTEEEYKSHIEALPDLKHESVLLTIDEESKKSREQEAHDLENLDVQS